MNKWWIWLVVGGYAAVVVAAGISARGEKPQPVFAQVLPSGCMVGSNVETVCPYC
jgi:hydroxyethylthiazole kinase-like sugar kinase family protein